MRAVSRANFDRIPGSDLFWIVVTCSSLPALRLSCFSPVNRTGIPEIDSLTPFASWFLQNRSTAVRSHDLPHLECNFLPRETDGSRSRSLPLGRRRKGRAWPTGSL